MSDMENFEGSSEVVDFDLNDPELQAEVPDFGDPEGSAEMSASAPPPDGTHRVALLLRESEQKAGVEVKRGKDGQLKVQANIAPRFVKEDGTLGQFIRGYYPSTAMSQWERDNLGTSKLAFLCRLAGKPLQRGMNLKAIAEHVQALFDKAGEEGVRVYAKTRWLKSVPVVDEAGLPVIDGQYQKREDVKGMKAIQAQAGLAAKSEALEAGLTGEEVDEAVRKAIARAHIFVNPTDGEELTVQAEISTLVDA